MVRCKSSHRFAAAPIVACRAGRLGIVGLAPIDHQGGDRIAVAAGHNLYDADGERMFAAAQPSAQLAYG